LDKVFIRRESGALSTASCFHACSAALLSFIIPFSVSFPNSGLFPSLKCNLIRIQVMLWASNQDIEEPRNKETRKQGNKETRNKETRNKKQETRNEKQGNKHKARERKKKKLSK